MKTVLHLIHKDIIRFIKDKPAVILTFLVPAILIVIFGNIFGGRSGSQGKARVIFVNEAANNSAKFLEERLDSSESIRLIKKYKKNDSVFVFDAETAKQFVKDGKYSAALVIPSDFLSDTSTSVNLQFFYDPKNEIELYLIQGSVQQTVMSSLPEVFPKLIENKTKSFLGDGEYSGFVDDYTSVISQYFNVDKDSIISSTSGSSLSNMSGGSSEGGDFMKSLMNFESIQLVGNEIKNPGITRIVGGWAMMFLLFSLTGASISLFEEKQEGTLKRLMCMPIKRTHLLWSKYIYSILLGIVQLLVLFMFSWVLFDVEIFNNFFNLLIVMIVSASAAVAFGMLITSYASSINQANGLATLFILVMSALGGSWFPVSLFPDWLETIAHFTITYWSVEAFQDVLWRQVNVFAILPQLSVLIGFTIIVNIISLRRFNKGKII